MGLRGGWVAVAIWLSACSSDQTVPCAGARLGHRRIAAANQAFARIGRSAKSRPALLNER
jgi:hypothetical protein